MNILIGWDLDGRLGALKTIASPNKPIFCAPCRVVKPRVNSLRPKGLGLGASLTEVQTLAPTSPHYLPRPDEEQKKDKEDQSQGLVPGRAVVVLSGPHRGLYGKVRNQDMPGVQNRHQGGLLCGSEGRELGLG